MKEFLSREGFVFVDRNVEEDETAYRNLLALGFRAVPVTVIGGTAIVGYDPDRLLASLRESLSGQPGTDRGDHGGQGGEYP